MPRTTVAASWLALLGVGLGAVSGAVVAIALVLAPVAEEPTAGIGIVLLSAGTAGRLVSIGTVGLAGAAVCLASAAGFYVLGKRV